MPLDSGGKFRHNSQVAAMHSKGKDEMKSDKTDAKPMDDEGSEKMTEVHDHGDGSFHTVSGGEQEDHETIGHLHAKLSSLHGSPGQKHFHAHSDGMEHHSHSVETGGEADHRDHEDEGGMEQHLGESMSGEHGSPMDDGQQESNESAIGGY